MMDAKYLAEIKARCDEGRPTARIDVKALIGEVERLTEENADSSEAFVLAREECDRLLRRAEEAESKNATLKKALVLMGNDLADWMGNGTGEFWARDYTQQEQEQEGKSNG